jgi:hypothetical protein
MNRRGATADDTHRRGHWRRYRILYAIILVCVTPIVASYLAYYVFPPVRRTNYGALLPPRSLGSVELQTLDGRPFDFRQLAGKWILVTAAGGECTGACPDALLQMRQQRLMTGKDSERVERVWLIIDNAPLSTLLMREYEGTYFVRAPAGAVSEWMANGPELNGVVWLVDPMGTLMLRWPRDPDPRRVKADLARLLTASSHWIRVEKTQ